VRSDDLTAGTNADPRSPQGLLRPLPVAVFMTDAAGYLTFYNAAAAELWGAEPELGTTQWCGSWRLLWPDGRNMPPEESAAAVALRDGTATHGLDVIVERADGTRSHVLAYADLMRDGAGAPTGAVTTLVDVGAHREAEFEIQRLASIVESSDDGIVSKDLEGIIQSWNRGAEQLFGYSADEIIGRSILTIIPAERHGEEDDIMARIRRGEHVQPYETKRRRKDGSSLDISLTVSPITDGRGRVVGASKIARDITDRKRAEMQQDLLMREMSHRLKNVFAVATSVVSLSARSARTPAEMSTAVRTRLQALTRVQELTRPGLLGTMQAPESVELKTLVRVILSPYLDERLPPERQCAHFDGPAVRIGEEIVTSFALVLHEFATNAAKYGALSVPGGTIVVRWALDDSSFHLEWREVGGPAIGGAPDHQGFGAVLAARTVNTVFDGSLSYEWAESGLIIRLAIPAKRMGLA
jgi:PAS domain S-box-containing protein